MSPDASSCWTVSRRLRNQLAERFVYPVRAGFGRAVDLDKSPGSILA
jgi:hypothetical protein